MAKLRAQPKNVPVPLPADGLPVLVTFDDIADPTSVERVDPADLTASFGPGVELKAVTLEITDEPVTVGYVEAVLGVTFFRDWSTLRKEALAKVSGLDDPYFSTLNASLARDNFVQGKRP